MAVPADAHSLAEIYRPYVENTPITFEYDPPSPQEMVQRMQSILPRYPYLVWEEDGRILAYAYAHTLYARAAYQWDAELSVYVHWDHRGKGIGRALYSALIELLRRQGYYSLYACITVPNPSSMAMHRRLGFVNAGIFENAGYKQGKWYGVGWLVKHLRSFEDGEAPMPPIPAAGLTQEELQDIFAPFERLQNSGQS